jgi:hypothetical protein
LLLIFNFRPSISVRAVKFPLGTIVSLVLTCTVGIPTLVSTNREKAGNTTRHKITRKSWGGQAQEPAVPLCEAITTPSRSR